MAAYLLGTQAFVDASRNDVTNPVRRWSSCYDVALDDAFVSAASFMPIRMQLETLGTAQRVNWQILFETAMDKYERAGRIVPVSHRIAARAGELATTAVQLRAGGTSARLVCWLWRPHCTSSSRWCRSGDRTTMP